MIRHIKQIISWSADKPRHCADTGSIKDIVCRNWRTWLGHATVVTNLVAISSLPLIAFPESTVFRTVAMVGYLAGIVFYAWREFGVGGNFYDNDSREKQTDSIYDLAAPVFAASFVFFNLVPALRIAAALVMNAITLFIFKRDGKNGAGTT